MKLASIASNRLEVLLGRIVSLALLLNGIEPVVNGVDQLPAMNSIGLSLLGVFMLTTLLAAVGGWTSHSVLWFKLHAIAVMAIILLSPLGYESELEDPGRPWVWWALGMAAVIFGVSQRTAFRYLFIVLMGMSWFAVFGFGLGVQQTELAILDALYIIVFAIAIVTLTELVRQGAAEVDEANSAAIESALEQAKVDAVERERARLDALMHDQVMHTLLLAARAETKEEQLAAVRSAESAIDSLAKVGTEISGEVSSMGLLQAIERAAKKLDPRIQVTVSGADSVTIPAIVAEAITEATLQAVDNAIQHSKARRIDLDLKAKKGLLDFTISDDGVGFRFDRISRYRIGIRISILGRLRSIGGFADVQSAPQEGTKVILRWSNA